MYTLHKKAKKIGLHWWKSTVIRACTVCELLICHVKKRQKPLPSEGNSGILYHKYPARGSLVLQKAFEACGKLADGQTDYVIELSV